MHWACYATWPERPRFAKAYVDALVSHNTSEVRLHPDCTRHEMGVKTGRNGGHIARSLAFGPQFKLIHEVSDFTATVDGDQFWFCCTGCRDRHVAAAH